MRFWLHSSAKAQAFGHSMAISIVTHAVLVGAGVYGTAVSARQLTESIAQAIRYLPPPDRRPQAEQRVEHLQFIDVGLGAVASGEAVPQGKAPIGPPSAEAPGGLPGKDMRLEIPVDTYETPDSVYSILQVDESAARADGSGAPIYPPGMIKAKIEGSVRARFVVDTTGRADPESVVILKATNDEFTEAVTEAIPRMAFTPAIIAGRRVRQMVEQSFGFKLEPLAAPPEQTRTKRRP